MKLMRQSIVFKYVFVVGLSLLAVSAAGVWSGSTLLSDMGALSDDARFLNALKMGRDSVIEFRDQRNAAFERIVAHCIKSNAWPTCEFFGHKVVVEPVSLGGQDAEALPNLVEGWVLDDSYVVKVDGKFFSLKVTWRELKPLYRELSEVINTRAHLSEVFPKVRQSFISVFTLSIGIVGCFGIAAVYFLSRRLRRRVGDLTSYAHQIATGELSPAPIGTKGGDEIGLLSDSMEKMAKDLSETREKLVFTQKMQSWQTVARKVAHEIKNPLTPITIVADQLQRCQKIAGPQLQEILAEASRILYDEAGALSRMVKEFTAFARLPDPHLEQLDAIALVRDFVMRNARAEGPTFKVTAPETSCVIMADRGMLMQIFHNLVNNAVLAKPAPMRASIEFIVTVANERLIVDICDDGPGVPEQLRATMFDAYVTSRSTGEGEKGMGLGLTISRKIATDHNGALRLLRTGPGGSVFRLELPKVEFFLRHVLV